MNTKNLTGKLVIIGMLLAAAFAVGVNLWRDSTKVSGAGYTDLLIRMSENGSKPVPVGSPKNILTRVCFIPPAKSVRADAEAAFGGLPVLYQESSDANVWHVAMHAPSNTGIWILKGDGQSLSWSNPATKPVCPATVKLAKSDAKYTFAPVAAE